MKSHVIFAHLGFLLSDRSLVNPITGAKVESLKEITNWGITVDQLFNSVQGSSHFVPRDYQKTKIGESNYRHAMKCLEFCLVNDLLTEKQIRKLIGICEIKLRFHKNAPDLFRPAKKQPKRKSKAPFAKAHAKRPEEVLKGEATRSTYSAGGRTKTKGSGRSLI